MIVRKKYLDYAKGFAILCMLLTHCMGNVSDYKMGIWIVSFNMPIFFIVGGIITCFRGDTKNIVIRRIKQLGVPYVFWCVVLMVFYNLLSVLAGNGINIMKYAYKIITLQGVDSLWFIPCFFFAEILVMKIITAPRLMCAVFFVVLIISGIVFCNMKLSTNWLMDLLIKILVCSIFYYFGYWIENKKIIENIPLFISVLMIIIEYFLAQKNGSVGIGGLEFNNFILFFVNAFISSVAILSIFYRYERSERIEMKILNYFGRNSIVILCTNNILIEIARLADYKLTGNILLKSGLIGSVGLAFILALIEAEIIKRTRGSIGYLFGKGK